MNTVLSVSKNPVSAKLVRTMPLVIGLLLGGCISSNYAPPKERALESPADLGLSAAPAPVADPEWWTVYQDTQLDHLMRGALADNPTLAQSLARVREAQAEAAAVHADSWPSITYSASEARKRLSGHDPIPPPYADIYGGAAVYHGKLVGLSAGSGTAFALLPAQNASGNWIKIVQRLPVRIELDSSELRAHPLRIGLSVTASVDIRDTSGPLVSQQVRQIPIPSQASLADDPQEDDRIAQIVRDNLGLPQGASKIAANLSR